jgi:hypothetical protein
LDASFDENCANDAGEEFMDNAAKVGSYLTELFPDDQILMDPEDRTITSNYIFLVQKDGHVLHTVTVSYEFLADTPTGKMRELLIAWDLRNALRLSGGRALLITTSGIQEFKPTR